MKPNVSVTCVIYNVSVHEFVIAYCLFCKKQEAHGTNTSIQNFQLHAQKYYGVYDVVCIQNVHHIYYLNYICNCHYIIKHCIKLLNIYLTPGIAWKLHVVELNFIYKLCFVVFFHLHFMQGFPTKKLQVTSYII